jgi:hypothetical protein
MSTTNQIPERHPRAVQKRVGEALASGTVAITRSVEEAYAQVMALRLTGLDTNEAATVVLAAQTKRIADLLEACVDGPASISTSPLHD